MEIKEEIGGVGLQIPVPASEPCVRLCACVRVCTFGRERHVFVSG